MRQAGTLQGRGHLAPLTVITKPPEKKSRLTRKEQQKIIADLKATVAANERELSRAAVERRCPSFAVNSSGLSEKAALAQTESPSKCRRSHAVLACQYLNNHKQDHIVPAIAHASCAMAVMAGRPSSPAFFFSGEISRYPRVSFLSRPTLSTDAQISLLLKASI